MKRRVLALVCALTLCFGLLPGRTGAAVVVYFTSVNDSLLPLTKTTMPTWADGTLYVPASVFDQTATGVDLGLYQSQSGNTITLYSLRKMLVFDLARGSAYNQHTGQELPHPAINRNGRIYLPVEAVCEFFGLGYSYLYTQYGYLIRVKSRSAALTDESFLDKAGTSLGQRLQEYIRSQQAQSPNLPGTPGVTEPDPPEQEDQPKVQRSVYLAFRCKTGEGLEQALTELDRTGSRGIFFFSTQTLAQQDDLIRRVVGSGHCIGLLAEGETAEQSRQMLNRANRLLNHIACTAATAALVPSGQSEALEEQGWVCWQQSVDAAPRAGERSAAYTRRILRAMENRRRSVYLTLDDSRQTAALLGDLLRTLEQENARVITPLEVRL